MTSRNFLHRDRSQHTLNHSGRAFLCCKFKFYRISKCSICRNWLAWPWKNATCFPTFVTIINMRQIIWKQACIIIFTIKIVRINYSTLISKKPGIIGHKFILASIGVGNDHASHKRVLLAIFHRTAVTAITIVITLANNSQKLIFALMQQVCYIICLIENAKAIISKAWCEKAAIGVNAIYFYTVGTACCCI